MPCSRVSNQPPYVVQINAHQLAPELPVSSSSCASPGLGHHHRGSPHRSVPDRDTSYLFQSLGVDDGHCSPPDVGNVDVFAIGRETEPAWEHPCRDISQQLEVRERVDENAPGGC